MGPFSFSGFRRFAPGRTSVPAVYRRRLPEKQARMPDASSRQRGALY
jgi:hypothetical protein